MFLQAQGGHGRSKIISDSKVHGANMGAIWGRQDPGGPHVGPMNLDIWDVIYGAADIVPNCYLKEEDMSKITLLHYVAWGYLQHIYLAPVWWELCEKYASESG